MNIGRFFRERISPSEAPAAGGPSFAHVFGAVLAFILVLEAVTGAALAAFYSPSTTDAWASVAYLQDQADWGWLVRGLHYHGASAIVIVTGLHLAQTAIWGAYKKPRELTWWLGVLLLLLVLAFAITGYVLRWDQAGYWANRVEIGIAASTPIIGNAIRKLAIGGNEYGNLTLTRFYALHVVVLPGVVTAIAVGHVWLARRHGPTPRWGVLPKPAPRWPAQTMRDVVAMTIAFAALLAYVVNQHGADLAAPADPTSGYDARPLWYFRWLFELRHIAGSFERLAALVAPAVVAGFLIALPLLDARPERAPNRRLPWLGALAGIAAVIGAMTLASIRNDADDEDLAKRQAKDAQRAERARELAKTNGVPVTGALDVFTTAPMYKGRSLYEKRCKSCHDEHSKDRKGPIIGPGHGNRVWITNFLKAPSDDHYWGRTKLVKSDSAMKPVELAPNDLDDLVETLYGQTGATDVVTAKIDRGRKLFDGACNDCHSLDDGVSGSGPNLAGLGTRDHYTSFIGNPKSPVHMNENKSEMPRFDKELTLIERDAIAEYLVWLRTATQKDIDALGPL
jgi:ubiquinol-cytochrome c reductase cytochrome b subunit